MIIGDKARFFFIFYMLNSNNSSNLSTHIFNQYLFNEESHCASNSRAIPAIFCMEKNIILFSLNLF